jgi:NitT/TauT family transport system substrate-binding protein
MWARANRKLAIAMLHLRAWNLVARRAALALALVGVASCSRNEAEPLRIGINAWPGYELFFLADELNYFEAEGVDVRLVEQVSLKDTRRVYGRGLIDGMLGTPMDLVAINVKQDRAATAEFAFSYSSGGDAIVSRREFRSMRDLRGKRIAIEQGLGDYFLTRALESAGMSIADVEVVYLPYPVAEESLRTGDVEAVHTFTPILRRLTQDEKHAFQIVYSSREIPDEIIDLLIVDPEIASTRAEDMDRVERAYDRACRFLEEQPDRAFDIMADREGVTSEEMERAFREDLTLIKADDRDAYLTTTGSVTLTMERFRAMLASPQPSVTRNTMELRD